jgi:glycosyltransferase involved in cell wall biosynthesis
MAPVFSILITSFNYGDYVGNTIESVLAQTYQDWELFIVDDRSSDNSREVISQFKDPRIRIMYNEKNLGESATYNRGLSACAGRYIAVLDSDDLFAVDKLRAQAEFLANNAAVDICPTFIFEIDAAGRRKISETRPKEPWFNAAIDFNVPESWIWQNHLCHSSAVVRRQTHETVGGLEENLTYTNDWSFWVRCLAAGARFATLTEPLTFYRNHGANLTHGDPIKALIEYAFISGTHLHPYLAKIKREDLIEANAKRFLQDELLLTDSAIANECLIRLDNHYLPSAVRHALGGVTQGMG